VQQSCCALGYLPAAAITVSLPVLGDGLGEFAEAPPHSAGMGIYLYFAFSIAFLALCPSPCEGDRATRIACHAIASSDVDVRDDGYELGDLSLCVSDSCLIG